MVALTFGIITYTLNIKWESATMWQYCQRNPIEMFALLLSLPFNPSDATNFESIKRLILLNFLCTFHCNNLYIWCIFPTLFIAFALKSLIIIIKKREWTRKNDLNFLLNVLIEFKSKDFMTLLYSATWNFTYTLRIEGSPWFSS